MPQGSEPDERQSQEKPLTISVYREEINSPKTLLEEFNDIFKLRKQQLPKELIKVHQFKGKRAKRCARKIEGLPNENLSRPRDRKALASLSREAKLLGKTVKVMSDGLLVLDCLDQTLKGLENIQKEQLSHKPSTYVTESIYRVGEMLADGTVSGLLVTGIVSVGSSLIMVPVYFLAHYKIRKSFVTPAWDLIESKSKPIVREWMKKAENYLWDFNADQASYIGTLNTDSPANTDEGFEAIFKIASPEVTNLMRQSQIIRTMSLNQFERTQAITCGLYINNDGKLTAGLETAPYSLDEATVRLKAEIEKLNGEHPQAAIGTQVEFSEDNTGRKISVGAKLLAGAGGVGLAVSGSLAFSENIVITASTLLSTSNVAFEISFVITSSLALPAGLALLAGIGAVQLITTIKQATAAKQLPFLNNDNNCTQLANLLKKHRGKELNETIREKLITQITKCDTKNHASEVGRQILRCMNNTLKWHKHVDSMLIRWYDQHNFEHDINLYSADFDKHKKIIEDAIKAFDITRARKAAQAFQTQFPHEPAANEYQKILYDQEKLLGQTTYLLHNKSLAVATQFFDTAFSFSDRSLSTQVHLEFAEQLFGFQHYDEVIIRTDAIILELSQKNSLTNEEKTLKNAANYLNGLSELSKPFEQQNTQCFEKQLNSLPDKLRLALTYEILDELDLQRLESLKKIDEIESNEEIDEVDRLKQIDEIKKTLTELAKIAYNYAIKEFRKHPDENNLYLKCLELSIQLEDWDCFDGTLRINKKKKLELPEESINYLGEFSKHCAHAQEHSKKCIEHLKHIIESDKPTSKQKAIAYILLGDLKNQCDDRAGSIEAYKKGFELDRVNIDLIMLVVSDAINKHDYVKARILVEESAIIHNEETSENSEKLELFLSSLLSLIDQALNSAKTNHDLRISFFLTASFFSEVFLMVGSQHLEEKNKIDYNLPSLAALIISPFSKTNFSKRFFLQKKEETTTVSTTLVAILSILPFIGTLSYEQLYSEKEHLRSPIRAGITSGLAAFVIFGLSAVLSGSTNSKLSNGLKVGSLAGLAYGFFGGTACALNKYQHEYQHPGCPSCRELST